MMVDKHAQNIYKFIYIIEHNWTRKKIHIEVSKFYIFVMIKTNNDHNGSMHKRVMSFVFFAIS
jgi:hypothetical protein